MKVVTISGKAQHGKDSAASILKGIAKDNGERVLVTHYADLLKYVCRTFFDFNGEKDEKGRTLLQYVGTDVVRTQNPNFWVGFITQILKMFGDNWDLVIIPDTRFPNEITALRDAGFDVAYVRVERPNFDSPLTAEQRKHPSETALDDTKPDYRVINDGGWDKLWSEVERLYKTLKED